MGNALGARHFQHLGGNEMTRTAAEADAIDVGARILAHNRLARKPLGWQQYVDAHFPTRGGSERAHEGIDVAEHRASGRARLFPVRRTIHPFPAPARGKAGKGAPVRGLHYRVGSSDGCGGLFALLSTPGSLRPVARFSTSVIFGFSHDPVTE